jgi:hypothetical protein
MIQSPVKANGINYAGDILGQSVYSTLTWSYAVRYTSVHLQLWWSLAHRATASHSALLKGWRICRASMRQRARQVLKVGGARSQQNPQFFWGVCVSHTGWEKTQECFRHMSAWWVSRDVMIQGAWHIGAQFTSVKQISLLVHHLRVLGLDCSLTQRTKLQ